MENTLQKDFSDPTEVTRLHHSLKIGDRVRLMKSYHHSTVKLVGQVGKIVLPRFLRGQRKRDSSAGGTVCVRMEADGNLFDIFFYPEDLEKL